MTSVGRIDGDSTDEMMGLREAAEVLGVHPNTLRNWGAAGKLRELRVGTRGDRRYYRTDIQGINAKLLAAQEKRSRMTPDRNEGLGTIYGSGLGELMASYQQAHSMFARNYEYIAEVARSMSAVTFAAKQMVPISEMVSEMLLSSSGVFAAAAAVPRNFLVGPEILAIFSQQKEMVSVIAEMTRAFQPRYAALLVEAMVPAGRALASVNEIAKAAGGTNLAVQRASAVLASFRGFTNGVAERLPAVEPSEGESGLAVGELEVGSDVLDAGVGSLSGLVKLGPAPAVDDQVALNIFQSILAEVDRRRSQLIVLTPSEIAREVEQLSVVRISRATVRLLQARTRCNRAAQLVKGNPIFKATTETEDAAATLPLMIADDEETFRELINRLYKLIYESSGYFNRISGDFLNRYDVLSNVKHLRTHYFHDVDHGVPSEIRSKLRRPGEIFIGFAGAPVLRDAASWRRAQLTLITDLGDALDDLEDEASRPPS